MGRPQMSYAKRQREQAKRDKKMQKAEKRAQKKVEPTQQADGDPIDGTLDDATTPGEVSVDEAP
ncbi:MAG: hypothetical protein ACYC7A_08875 [Thermoanaerobaculia bacterium]